MRQISTDYSDYLPWADNLNWFGLPWKPRGPIMKAADWLYENLLLLIPLGGWHWKGWRTLALMRARFYFEFRHELECPEAYGRETMDYDFLNGKAV